MRSLFALPSGFAISLCVVASLSACGGKLNNAKFSSSVLDTVSIIAKANLSPSSTALSFGSVAAGGVSSVTQVTVSNSGIGAASNVFVELASATQFTMSNNSCGTSSGKISVAPGFSCTFDLRFSPVSAGAKSDTLTLTYDNGESTALTATVALSGTGLGGCAAIAGATTYNASGAGSRANPYLICTARQLLDIGNHAVAWNAHFVQGANIDLTGYNQASSPAVVPIGSLAIPFKGRYDGQSYAISNLSYDDAAHDYVGLFGYVEGPAVISNVRLVNASITGEDLVGALVGGMHAAIVSNCHSAGAVVGRQYVGGLIGQSKWVALISGSHSDAAVSFGDSGGGLVGNSLYATVTNSFATGNVVGPVFGGIGGGLVGRFDFGFIKNSYATGNVSTGYDQVGGLVGLAGNGGTITNSFATGNVTGGNVNVGFLVGDSSFSGTITGSYYRQGASCTNTGAGGTGNCTRFGTGVNTVATPSYFFDPSNAPLSSWDFANDWVSQLVSSGLPSINPSAFDLGAWGDCSSHASASPFAGGNGTFERPYLICTPAQLANLGSGSYLDANAQYKLMADLDMTSFSSVNIPIGKTATPFLGGLDGNGHVISNFSFSNASRDDVGLFGYVSGRVVDLTMSAASVTGQGAVGILAGSAWGLVDHVNVSGVVTGYQQTGGMIGAIQEHARVVFSSSTATVTGGWDKTGGLAGYSFGYIVDSFSTGSVTGGGNLGGLLGNGWGYGGCTDNCSRVYRSYATGSVNGVSNVGGLVGLSQDGTWVVDSFATGDLTGNSSGSDLGLLIGVTGAGTFTGLRYRSGAACINAGSGGTAGCTALGTGANVVGTPDYFFLKTNAPISSWDFDYVWREISSAYPGLR